MNSTDVAPMWDTVVFNAGFIAIRPTPLGIQLYLLIRQMTQRSKTLDDQQSLNRALRILKKRNSTFSMHMLNRQNFLSGCAYWESGGRLFPRDKDCNPSQKPTCPVVVHNNWIVGKNAKVYRFREHLMWLYDGTDNYYSSKTRNYLTYTNPKSPEATIARQLEALKSAFAIGHLLNRVVILPRFLCSRNNARECPLNSLIRISRLDSYFNDQYRESSFLRHRKVPAAVKRSLYDGEKALLRTNGSDTRITSREVLQLFRNITARVLNVGSLLGVKVSLDDKADDEAFNLKIQRGIRRASYRQY